MNIQNKVRNQDAVYWAALVDRYGKTISDQFGAEQIAPPVQIKVYWMDKTLAYVDGGGATRNSTAVIIVGQDTPVGGILWRGKLSDIEIADRPNPRNIYGAFRIGRFEKFPTPKGDDFVRLAYL